MKPQALVFKLFQ